jgi:two-component system invasion response regulator UvrY
MDEAPSLSVLLVDDHALVRRGLRELLADEFPGAVFTEAGTGAEAVEQIGRTAFTLVMLDLSIPGRDGLDVLKEFHERLPKLPILVLSVHAEEQYAVRALRAGAAGYITKECAPEELSKAIRKVLTGGRYVSSSLAERLATNLSNDAGRPLHESLSDRELQVLRMVAVGKSVKQIGMHLALSEKTISTYRARILEKMDMLSNADLMRYALRTGLVD